MRWTTEDYVVVSFLSALGLIIVLILFVVVPRVAYVDAKCLEAGYPKSSVTWNLKGYCLNLDGDVTGKATRLEDSRPQGGD